MLIIYHTIMFNWNVCPFPIYITGNTHVEVRRVTRQITHHVRSKWAPLSSPEYQRYSAAVAINDTQTRVAIMMTSWNGTILRITGHMFGEFTIWWRHHETLKYSSMSILVLQKTGKWCPYMVAFEALDLSIQRKKVYMVVHLNDIFWVRSRRFYPYPSGFLHWHWGNLTIVSVLIKVTSIYGYWCR